MESKNKFPPYIMEVLRQMKGLDNETDTSKDEEINLMSMNEAFDEYLKWEGIIGYTETIQNLIKDIYHVELPNK